MAEAMNLNDDLIAEERGWAGRLITAAILFVIAAFAFAAVWYFAFRDEATTTRATEDVAVGRKTINTTVLVSGIADAELSSDLTFQSGGKIDAVFVKTGDVVRQGQVLAQLESDDLQNAVASAQTNLRTAQLRLQDLLQGSTPAELEAARQALALAQSNSIKADNEYQDLLDGATASEVAKAEQAVKSAESQVATAQSQLETLQSGASDADLAAAQAGVAAAESALRSAENSADSASNTATSAAASLKSAEASYCVADNAPAFCGTPATPISSADATLMQTALGGSNASLASGVITANTTYRNALNSKDSAEASVDSAKDGLDSAKAKLAGAREGATPAETAAARAAVTAANASLTAAQDALTDLQDGADESDLSSSAAAADSARASVKSAQAKLNEALRGAEANDIAQSREAVQTAQLAVEAAQLRIKDTQIISPFDGTVGAVNISPGEFVSAAGTKPPIVLLTPDHMQLKMDVGETDYPNVKVGQGGGARFDGLPTNIFVFVVSQIGLSPTTTQGVVTYPVTATLIIPPDSPKPAPGMSASGQLRVDSKPDVLVVPSRAIRRRGSDQIVDVRRNGVVEEQVITTGVSDTDSVEVLTGVNEGETVVVPKLRGPDDQPDAQPTIPGGIR